MTASRVSYAKARRALVGLMALLECADLPADLRDDLELGANAARALCDRQPPIPGAPSPGAGTIDTRRNP